MEEKKPIKISNIWSLSRSSVTEFCRLSYLIYHQILTWCIFFMCICYDSVLTSVDVSVIVQIYYHVWNDILPLTICVILLHWFQILIWKLVSEFRAWVCFYSTWKTLLGTFCQTRQDTTIWSSITACEATAMILFLYSANLLFSSVQPRVKQCQLRNSSPKIKGLVNPSHTMNLWQKLDGPILKLPMTEPMSWPFTGLIHLFRYLPPVVIQPGIIFTIVAVCNPVYIEFLFLEIKWTEPAKEICGFNVIIVHCTNITTRHIPSRVFWPQLPYYHQLFAYQKSICWL